MVKKGPLRSRRAERRCSRHESDAKPRRAPGHRRLLIAAARTAGLQGRVVESVTRLAWGSVHEGAKTPLGRPVLHSGFVDALNRSLDQRTTWSERCAEEGDHNEKAYRTIAVHFVS